jgi:hypothetical protein
MVSGQHIKKGSFNGFPDKMPTLSVSRRLRPINSSYRQRWHLLLVIMRISVMRRKRAIVALPFIPGGNPIG